jgi:hypothetical protein
LSILNFKISAPIQNTDSNTLQNDKCQMSRFRYDLRCNSNYNSIVEVNFESLRLFRATRYVMLEPSEDRPKITADDYTNADGGLGSVRMELLDRIIKETKAL